MKTLSIFTSNESQSDDKLIDKEHNEIKSLMYNNGMHDGLKSPPEPPAQGGQLSHYTGIKSRYEGMVIKLLQRTQPIVRIAEGKIEKEQADNRIRVFSDTIDKIKKQIEILKRELKGFDSRFLTKLMQRTVIIGVLLCISEMMVNNKAFQILGDNKIMTYVLSFSVSFAVTMGAHYAGRTYKDAKSKRERTIILIITSIGLLIISSMIAYLRHEYLATKGIAISSLPFIGFNILFFLIGAIVTYYHYPSKELIYEHRDNLQKHKEIVQLEKQKAKVEAEKQEFQRITNDKYKEYVSTLMYAMYAIERIKMLYREAVEEYIRANRMSRKEPCECHNDPIPPLEIPNINFQSIINFFNQNNHENND